MATQNYTRPGIYINEINNSIIPSPVPVAQTTTLVIGFSKKGPVNRPVLLNTPNDLTNIFGTVDRSLERSGSFFHRTINQMLLSSPVYGMNLLLTDDNLDKLQYSSLSTTSENSNYINSNGKPYRRFFDNNGFWVRDTESFLTVIEGDPNLSQRVLNFTNMSDKTISIFVYKSQYTSPYNVTLLNWYGTVDKIPAYLRPTDYVSDYLVDVLVVSGDWTNYQSLSVDSKWNKYFDSTGLKKTQTANFINDRNVNTLAQYTAVSLIPYFKDQNGNNMFIETIINSDTDKTGLYCAFDIDKYETDYPNGLVDLIGNNLVNQDINSINFLSYKDIITETVSYNNIYLDRPGNVISLGNYIDSTGYRTTYLQEGYINGIINTFTSSKTLNPLTFSSTQSYGTSSSPLSFNYNNVDFNITRTNGIINSITLGDSSIDSVDFNNGDTIYISATALGASSSIYGTVSTTFIPTMVPTYYYVYVTDIYGNSSYIAISNLPNGSTTNDVANDIYNQINGYRGFSATYSNGSVTIFPPNGAGNAYNNTRVDYYFYDNNNNNFNYNSTFYGATYSVTIPPFMVKFSYTYSIDISYSLTDSNNGNSKTLTSTQSYVVINGNKIPVNNSLTYSINSNNISSLFSKTGNYATTFVVDTTGTIIAKNNFSNNLTLPSVNSSDIVLGYSEYFVDTINNIIYPKSSKLTNAATSSLYNIGLSGSSYLPLSSNDFTSEIDSNGNLSITFSNTSNNNDYTNYYQWRRIKMFNYLLNFVGGSNFNTGCFIDSNTGNKVLCSNMSLINSVTSTDKDKSLVISGFPSSLSGNLTNVSFYILDNEFTIGKKGFVTGTNSNTIIGLPTLDTGIVSANSTFYNNFYSGIINNGDFFYYNILSNNATSSVVFSGNGYIQVSSNVTLYEGYKYLVPQSVNNTTSFVVTATTATQGYYKLQDSVVDETISIVNVISNTTDNYKIYLQMDIDSNSNLITNFVTSDLSPSTLLLSGAPSFFSIISDKSDYKETVEVLSVVSDNTISVNGSRYSNVVVGDFLSAYVDPSITLQIGESPKRLARVLSKKTNPSDNTQVLISCDSKINITTLSNGDMQTLRFANIDNYVSTYKGISMNGFKIRQASMPNGTETQQNNILNLIANGTPLFSALTNKDVINFRYIIDSFGLGLTEYSKQQYADICGERLDTFCFVNVPSMKQFKNSANPSFVNSEGVLQTAYIAQGGNPDNNPSYLYSLATGNGAARCGYFLPYVTVDDNGRPLDVPPAMFVATSYMKKINSNSSLITPWTIIAGIINGGISGFGSLEMDFAGTDISNLNMASLNPIVSKKNRGFAIETENTAMTEYKSSLSYIHAVEVLIELEDDLRAMLMGFQWSYNTADVRAQIKHNADSICQSYVNRNGLYNYFNKCDSENNTSIIIDNQEGVLDTFIEIIKGMGVIVNNITVLSTGSIQSSGFYLKK